MYWDNRKWQEQPGAKRPAAGCPPYGQPWAVAMAQRCLTRARHALRSSYHWASLAAKLVEAVEVR